MITHHAIDLGRSQHLLPLPGAAFAEKVLVGAGWPLAKTLFPLLRLQPRER
jgi:hypothetical protein